MGDSFDAETDPGNFIYLSVSSDGVNEDFDDIYSDYDFFIAVNSYYNVTAGNSSSTALPSVSQVVTRSTTVTEEGTTEITIPVRVDINVNSEVGNKLLEAAGKK